MYALLLCDKSFAHVLASVSLPIITPMARKRFALHCWCAHACTCHQSNEAFAVQAAAPEEAAVKRLGAADIVLVALAAYLLLWHMPRYLLRRRRRVAPQPGAHEQ